VARMVRVIAAGLAVVLAPRASRAQQTMEGHGAFVGVGAAWPSISHLNAAVTRPGARFAGVARDVSAGVYVVEHGWMLAPSADWVKWADRAGVNGARSSLRTFAAGIDLGRLVSESRRSPVFPEVGASWARTTIGVTKALPSDPVGSPGSFTFATTIPGPPLDLHRDAIVETLGIGMQRYLVMKPFGSGERGLYVGLHAGVRLAQDLGEWRANGQRVTGGPRGGSAGPFVMLTFGPGEWSR
jgi:hypothetical protein